MVVYLLIFFADQTPTPTRFIRNCEEVGLFQDLQNVNPFEETFRNAIELGKKGLLAVPTTSSEDSLHTPHILPHLESSINGNGRSDHGDTDIEVLPFNQTKVSNREDAFDPILFVEVQETSAPDPKENNVIKPSVNCVPPNNVKLKLKKTLKHKVEIPTKRPVDVLPVVTHPLDVLALVTQNDKDNCDNSVKFTGDKCVLERKRAVNRAAQVRSRERKKVQQIQMEIEMKQLKEGKRKLFLENKKLRQDIRVLKTVLLYHQNCSVTRNPEKSEY